MLTRCDSAFYNADVVAAIGRGASRFSITARIDKAVTAAATAATAAIALDPRDGSDRDQVPERDLRRHERRWISDAEVAETTDTAFGARGAGRAVTGRLIVRRVTRLHPAAGQGELLPATATTSCSPTARSP